MVEVVNEDLADLGICRTDALDRTSNVVKTKTKTSGFKTKAYV